MASTFSMNSASTYDGRYLTLTATQTKDVITNTSTINWTLTSHGGSVNYYSTGPTYLVINNTTVYSQRRIEWNEYGFPAGAGSVSGSITVAHTDDGTKTINVSLATAIYYGASQTASRSWELDTIPRAATIITAPDFTDEDNPTITYANNAGNSVSSLKAAIYLGNTALAEYRDIGKTDTSYTFNLTSSERARITSAITSSKTANVKFVIETVIGSNTFTKETEKILTIANANPTITHTEVDTNSTTIALTGDNTKFIPGASTLRATMSASGQKSATINTTQITVNGTIYSSTSANVSNYDGAAIRYYARDSRGNITQISTTPAVLDYIKPTINLEAKINGTGTAELELSGNYKSIDFGTTNNELTLKYRYKEESGSYGNWINCSGTPSYYNDTFSLTQTITGLDYTKKYTFQVRAIDKLYTINSVEVSKKALPIFDWSETDFNFNVPVDFKQSFSINGDELANVAISGSYNDLTDLPETGSATNIVSGNLSSDWNFSSTNAQDIPFVQQYQIGDGIKIEDNIIKVVGDGISYIMISGTFYIDSSQTTGSPFASIYIYKKSDVNTSFSEYCGYYTYVSTSAVKNAQIVIANKLIPVSKGSQFKIRGSVNMSSYTMSLKSGNYSTITVQGF